MYYLSKGVNKVENIAILHLITGEDVLGQITEGDTVYGVTDPVGVSIVRQPNGQPGVGFVPFPMHRIADPSDPPKKGYTIAIPRASVVYSYVPAQDFIDNYNQIYGSGIVLPNKQIITG
jgi:hypothetical protein